MEHMPYEAGEGYFRGRTHSRTYGLGRKDTALGEEASIFQPTTSPTTLRQAPNRRSVDSDTPNSANTVGRKDSLDSLFSRGTQSSSSGNASNKLILHTAPRRASIDKSRDGKKSPAMLIYKTTFGGKMNFSLIREQTLIGRKEDNHIVLTDAKISKYHAVVIKNEFGFWFKDCKSSNGSRVNGTLIDPEENYFLTEGDEIQIGSITLVFQDEQEVRDARNGGVEEENDLDSKISLVTILPSERKYEETVTIRAQIEADVDTDFRKATDVEDANVLREDYEKLRLAYELSKISLTENVNSLFTKTLDLIFDILPVDRGVILLVDPSTGLLATHHVKLRPGCGNEKKEILLSSTIIKRVYYSKACLVTSDACEDPQLGQASSVRVGQIRSVICVPLISHEKVHGILHLDSRDRINSFSTKDIGLVKAISNQAAIAIENTMLLKEAEQKARITEQLRRFLAPHVVERMITRQEMIKKGGHEIQGTIVFADIRGFTNLSEKCEPSEVVALLNDYFERLVKIVFKYDGVVDKYIGDALMAVFGTLDDEKDSEYRAVAASLEFISAIKDMNEERRRSGREPIQIGVGINTGPLVAGFIGAAQRLEYTCIGDTVNTSSRICGMASINQVLISDVTYDKVFDKVECCQVGSRQFKGKTKEVMVYEAIALKESGRKRSEKIGKYADVTLKNLSSRV